MSNTNIKKIIEEAKRVEEDSLYSSKRQFEAANFWFKIHLWIGIPATVLAAIAGASALSQFDNHNIIAGVLAIIVAALIAVSTFLNPNEKANNHQYAGNKYNSLKNRVRIFYEIDCKSDESVKNLIIKLKEFTYEKDELNIESPLTHRKAYVGAKKGIQEGEANYKIDSEK